MLFQKSSEHTIISYDKALLKKGVDEVCNLVKTTLGPMGRNVAIERIGAGPKHTPIVTNDGVSIARSLILKDPISDLGAQLVINVATKTDERAGDGTTGAMVLAQAIVDKVYNKLEREKGVVRGGVSAVDIYHQIEKESLEVVEKIKKMAKPMKTQGDLERVGIISAEHEINGKKIAEMAWKLGKYAHISLEEGFGSETKAEITPGMKFVGRYVDKALCTNNRLEAVMDDPHILVINREIDTQKEMEVISKRMIDLGIYQMVVIATGFSREVKLMSVLNANKAKQGSGFYFLMVEAGSLTTDEFEDLAIYTNARFFNVEKGGDYRNPGEGQALLEIPRDLGRAKRIVVDKDNVFVIGGKGNKDQINERVEELKQQQEIEKTDMFKKKIGKRISALTGGVGLIEIASETDVENQYLKLKAEDAIWACKGALEEGIVPGGGLCLKKIADEMPEDSILKEALKAPYRQIQETTGGAEIDEVKVIDPAKVVRVAVENACSFARTFLMIEGSIANNRVSATDELREALNKPWE